MFNQDMKGKEIQDASGLDYSLYCKNLKTGGEKSISDKYMITYMNANNDKLFFIAYDREEYFAAQNGTPEEGAYPTTSLHSLDFKDNSIGTLVAGEVQVFNVYDNDLIMFLSTNGMCRMKADGSEFEELKVTESGVVAQEVLPKETEDGEKVEETVTEE